MSTKSPCKNCPDRVLGCHSVCQKYKDYRDVCEHIRQERYRQNSLEDAIRNIHHGRRRRH